MKIEHDNADINAARTAFSIDTFLHCRLLLYVCFGREYINNFDLSVNLYDRVPPLDFFFYSEYRDTAEINYYPSWLAF